MTNPTRGRGIAMGLAAAGTLSALLLDGMTGDDLLLAYDGWQRTALASYYREAAAAQVFALLRSGLFGGAVPGNAPSVELPADHPIGAAELDAAASVDPELFRVLMRAVMLLDDQRKVASPEVAARVEEVLAAQPPAEAAGPADAAAAPPAEDGVLRDRAALEELLAPWA